ncbi:MAG: hypothetical protein CMO97_05985 [Woeseia sp.]|nr:hypothetical protein [Woeseia sp.]|tara:strand:- start:2758 stop:3129 length:372 start_codon:yes stop_codon:yes gene_type:complete
MIRPFLGRKFHEWDERELSVIMLAKEREWSKTKHQGKTLRPPLPCDVKNVKERATSTKSTPLLITSMAGGSKNEEEPVPNVEDQELVKVCAQVEARELLHKMHHINPALAQSLEQQFKDEGIL